RPRAALGTMKRDFAAAHRAKLLSGRAEAGLIAPPTGDHRLTPDPAATSALITNDAIVVGLLAAILGLVFWTSSRDGPVTRRFYAIFPPILLCYFLPSLLTTFGIVDPEESQ